MATVTDLVNAAISMIGHERILDIDTQNNRTAEVCRSLYPLARDATLRRVPWNCAGAIQTIGAVANPNPFEWQFAHQMPSSPYCLYVRRILAAPVTARVTGGSRFHPTLIPYRVVGRLILSNSSPITLYYTRRIEDVNELDVMTYDAIAERLASELAGALKKDMKEANERLQRWEVKMNSAAAIDSTEGGRDEYVGFELVSNR